MEQVENQIQDLTISIWEAMLKLPLLPHDSISVTPARRLAACVHITGAWQGAVTLACSASFAARAASIMFALPAGHQADTTETQDALGELTNMIGGNVKALLPEPCMLSLPAIVEGADYSTRIPHARRVAFASFTCEGEAVSVSLLERIPKAA